MLLACVFIFSVGGGNLEKNISPNLVTALQYAKTVGSKVMGVVGRDGGYTAKVADACVVVPTVNTMSGSRGAALRLLPNTAAAVLDDAGRPARS